MKLINFIKKEGILFLNSDDKFEVLNQMITCAQKDPLVTDFERYKKEVIDREKIIPTAVGKGIAIPHAKTDAVKDFFIIIGVDKKGIDWNALDGEPVKVIFLVSGPEEHHKYLQIISKLILCVKNKKRLDKIINADSPDDIYEVLKEI